MSPTPRSGRPVRWLLPRLLIVSFLLAPCALLVWKYTRHPENAASPTVAADPRLTFHSAYRNVRPEVRYVGDAMCAGCHADVAKTYHQHPMSRSLMLVTKESVPVAHHTRELDVLPVDLSIDTQGGQLTHHVRGHAARSTLDHAEQIRFLLGSGSRGQSALIDHDGLLFQSPLSWFSKTRDWGLAPGYGTSLSFDRPIRPACLYCHADRALPVAGRLNRYREPVFESMGIGCERCHGPGQLHVERQSRSAVQGPDDTIVNPANLPPALREAVCQQCHLTSTVRIPRAGRDTYDYRPGLPLHEFWAAFIQPREMTDNNKAVGQVEQMYASRCFQASKGKLGCISCHDPHVKPAEAEKTAYYRQRCLTCHTTKSCTLAVAKRQRAQDNCIQCHMPRSPSSDFAHTAATDHRIPRKPGQPSPSKWRLPRTGRLLVNFYGDLLDPHAAEARRDLGVALMLGGRVGRLPLEPAAREAWPLLAGVQPDDVNGSDARAWALWVVGRREAALADVQNVLQAHPDEEQVLRAAATFSARLKHNTEAVAYIRRVLAENPYDSAFHEMLAGVLARMGQWDEVEKECRLALRTNPTRVDARRLLAHCLLDQGRANEAGAELQTLQALQAR